MNMESVIKNRESQGTIIYEKLRKFIEASKDYISKDKFFETLDNKSKFIERFPFREVNGYAYRRVYCFKGKLSRYI